MFGDLSNTPLDHLSSLVDDMVFKMLSNTDNHGNWPEVVSEDVSRHTNDLKTDVFVTAGAVKGNTYLALPVGHERIDDDPGCLDVRDEGDNKKSPVDRQLIHCMQNSVIEWARIIRDVVIQDSAQPLIDGLNPTPNAEIAFWEARFRNLWNIWTQFQRPKLRLLATTLKNINSTYYPTLWNSWQDVRDALNQARDIVVYIKTLRPHLDELESLDFTEIKEKKFMPFRCLLEVVLSIWAQCKPYQAPVRMVVLLQEINNLLMESCKAFIDPENILKGELDESLEKVNIALDVMNGYKDLYESISKTSDRFFVNKEDIIEWTYSPNLVFPRYDNFVKRVTQLQFFFKTCIEYQKLEKVEFGGITGGALSQRVVEIFDEFNAEYKIFTERTYDPLDYNDKNTPSFFHDFYKFKDRMDDFDRRLGKCCCQGFDNCYDVESMFKHLAILGSLIDRPLIACDFDAKFSILLKAYSQDLDQAKRIYDTGSILLKIFLKFFTMYF